jgi:hypothetical protein
MVVSLCNRPFFPYSRVIHKVRKTQHQYPEFGHKQGEINKKKKKRPAKKYIRKKDRVKLRKVSPCLSFFLSASTAATNIFIAPTCTATIIPLEPCEEF